MLAFLQRYSPLPQLKHLRNQIGTIARITGRIARITGTIVAIIGKIAVITGITVAIIKTVITGFTIIMETALATVFERETVAPISLATMEDEEVTETKRISSSLEASIDRHAAQPVIHKHWNNNEPLLDETPGSQDHYPYWLVQR